MRESESESLGGEASQQGGPGTRTLFSEPGPGVLAAWQVVSLLQQQNELLVQMRRTQQSQSQTR